MLRKIAHGPDGKVDGAVDLAEPGAALAGAGGIDDGEELQRGRETQPSRSPSHSASCTISSSRRRCTPSHFRAIRRRRAARRAVRTVRPVFFPGRQSGFRCSSRRRIQRLRLQAGRRSEPHQAAGKHDRAPCARLTEKPHLTPHVRASVGGSALRVTGSFTGRGSAGGL